MEVISLGDIADTGEAENAKGCQRLGVGVGGDFGSIVHSTIF